MTVLPLAILQAVIAVLKHVPAFKFVSQARTRQASWRRLIATVRTLLGLDPDWHITMCQLSGDGEEVGCSVSCMGDRLSPNCAYCVCAGRGIPSTRLTPPGPPSSILLATLSFPPRTLCLQEQQLLCLHGMCCGVLCYAVLVPSKQFVLNCTHDITSM